MGPAFDLAQLEQQVGGNQRLVKQLIEILLEDMPTMLFRLERALLSADADELERHAHKLKGALQCVAAFAAERALEVERAARERRLQDARRSLERLKGELMLLELDLRRFIG